MNTGAVYHPLVFLDAAPYVYAFACQVPFAGRFGLGYSPVKASVAHSVDAAEFRQVGNHIGDQAVGIDVVDAEKQRCRLDPSVFGVSEYARRPGAICNGAVACGVDYHSRAGGFKAGGREQYGAAYAVAFHDGADKICMEKNFHAGIGTQPVIYFFKDFRIEGRAMVVALGDPGGKL